MSLTLIYIALIVVLAEFFIHYCRAILASSRKIQLPASVCEAAGVDRDGVAPGDFERFLELARVCPEECADHRSMRAVWAYYGLVRALGRASRGLVPRVESWAEKEQRNCSHFAAVALDRRISCTRKLFAQRVQSPF
ncbi:MAG: hypothetical protein ACLP3K_15715 [Candidatus Acidiferrales bacterium]